MAAFSHTLDEFTERSPFSDRDDGDMTLLAPPHVYSLPLFLLPVCILAAYLLVISHSLF